MPSTPAYDVFLSFADEDAAFAWRWLLPRLEQAGVSVCSEADFEGGAVLLEEYERLVDSSRHVLLVLSPSWIRGPWTAFAGVVAQHDDPTNRRRKILPLLLQAGTTLPHRLQGLVGYDFSGAKDREQELARLVATLRGDVAAHATSDAAPTFWTVPFRRNEHFVGREDDLTRLHDVLGAETQVGIRSAGLTGQGGIGKTQLAVEYCYRHRDTGDYPDGIFWVNAAEDWRQGFAALGTRVDPACADRPQHEQIRAAAAYFNAHRQALLVLDNVEDPAALLRPLADEVMPSSLPVRLLFTTRRRDLGQFAPVEVTVLPEDAALRLLLSHPERTHLLDPENPEYAEARRICRRLGYLPLAVEIAAAFLGDWPEISLADFRVRLESEGALATLDEEGEELASSSWAAIHDAAISAMLRAQWDQIRNADAQLLLRVAGQLGEAAQIPAARLGLLAGVDVAGRPGRPAPLQRALRRLHSLSLIEELSEDQIRLHPLVREFAADRTPKEQVLAFRRERAVCLFDAYSRVLTLENNCLHRGVSAVEGDVRTALDLVTNRNTATGKPDSLLNEVITRLRDLLRLLERSSHEIRDWDAAAQPAFFAQQIRNRSQSITLNVLHDDALARLTALAQPYLDLAWGTSRASPALIRTFTGHEDWVLSVAVMPNGTRAVSASDDRTLRVWDLDSGQPIAILTGHESSVTAVTVTPDGTRAVSASSDRTLRVWDLDSGQSIATLTGHESFVNAVAVTPDGTRALSASDDGTLRVWDLDSGRPITILTGHEDTIWSVAVTPDGTRAVSASDDRTLRVWDLDSGRHIATLTGHESSVLSVAVTPDGTRAVSASDDRTLRVWDLDSGRPIATLSGHSGTIWSVVVTPDGTRAVSASDDRTLRVWDLDSGRPIATLSGHEGIIWSVAMTPDGTRAVSASYDRTLRVWDLDSALPIATLTGHEARVRSVAVTPNGTRAISASYDGTLRVWDLDSGRPIAILTGHEAFVNAVAVTPDGTRAVSASYDHTLCVWDLGSERPITTLTGHKYSVLSVAVTPDGTRAVSASDDRTLRVWDLDSGQTIATLTGHEASVRSVAVTPDGTRAVSASFDRTLRVWDLDSGRPIATLTGHEASVRSVAMMPDGTHAVSASSDRTLRVWDLDSGQPIATLTGHKYSVLSVAVTPDGARAVSASSDRTLRVWDLDSGTCLAVVALDGAVETVAIAPNGETIVAGDAGGNVYCLRYVEAEPPSNSPRSR